MPAEEEKHEPAEEEKLEPADDDEEKKPVPECQYLTVKCANYGCETELLRKDFDEHKKTSVPINADDQVIPAITGGLKPDREDEWITLSDVSSDSEV